MLEREMRSQKAAHPVGHGQGEREVPPHMALDGEQDQGRQVGRTVEQFGAGRGVQEVIAEQTNEQEDKETAGTGTKESIVEAQRQPDGGRSGSLAPARQ